MACAGIDFGNKTSVVAIARRGGIDICCNEVSNRATPSMVSFQGAERHIGESAASVAAQNYKNTVGSLQRLIGLPRDTPFTEREAKRLTCPVVADPASGACVVKVTYTGVEDEQQAEQGQTSFTTQALVAMLLSDLMKTASNEYKAPVKDLVISVPVYYTEPQRRAILDAATIANVNILRVVNEHAAIALSYGIFRTKELPDTKPIKVAFVDIGEASTTVSITAFTNTRSDVLAVASDPSLGGRDLDDILVNKFAEEFKTKYSIDVLSKPKPSLRLRKECEKIKKILSTVPNASLNIECLMNDVDVKGTILRDEMEEIAAPLIARIRDLCDKAIADASLKPGENLTAVEIVGGSTRVPAFKAVITETFSKVGAVVRTTLNADECISRGCALMSAMLSPAFKVRDYVVSDIATHALDAEKVFTDGSTPESFTLVPKGNTIPCLKAMTFKSPGPLTVSVRYSDVAALAIGEEGVQICSYLVDAPMDLEAKVRAKIRVTANGTVELASTQLMKEVEVEEEVPIKVEEKPTADTPAVPAGTAPAEPSPAADTPMTDASADKTPAKPEEPAEAAPPAPEQAKEEAPKMEKRLVKKTKLSDLPVTRLPGIGHGLTAELVMAATEKEAKMRANDLYIRERSEAMNSLEAYVYDLRSRIDPYSGDLKDFGPEDMRNALKVDLDATEEWIYSEEAEASSKSAFVKKKNELVQKASKIFFRKKEFEERPVRVSVLEASIQNYKQVAVPGAEEYAHIADEEKNKLLKCAESTYVWLKEQLKKQEPLAKDQDPILTCTDLNTKLTELDRVCRPIQNTPKPKPKVEEKKPEEKDVDMMEEASANTPPNGNGAEKAEAVPNAKPAEAPALNGENAKMEVDDQPATAAKV
ncbi:unnamed protein product [Chondrus crispus]|uniref:Uncharacterized protein n=1 Tax=Chondrus crispus TaxID=2769 RepID=R7QH52_CHOCR|nr:unnamed protein product [Chondrus crispus]CDF36796.1 unnamed protein product [Chondrus crispus]|eukprot:XP_005716615.1 unnamed protein product [Chondrus crispus]